MQTIDELMKRYGAPGRIVFRPGLMGYPEVVLSNKYGTAEVALLGANTLSYRPTGHSPVLFCPKYDYHRGDSVHGGIPVCWPQFGNRAIPSMAQHGFARLMPFEVIEATYSDESTEIVLGLDSTPDTKAVWDHDFSLRVKISVSMKLNLTLTTTNTGKTPFEFTAGFHPYLRVADRNTTEVLGLDGYSFVNTFDDTTGVWTGAVAMTEPRNHVFSLPTAPKHELALMDPTAKRAIAVVSSGNVNAIVWNPGEGSTLKDLGPDDWRHFVCVEPVSAWPKAVRELAPGETHELLAAIQATLEEK